ncbi:MAG TPA: EAL domain-containing protein [Lapillicoccus sp.]|nr:EAL domain-containing protein [Lapillicoccus sp.]
MGPLTQDVEKPAAPRAAGFFGLSRSYLYIGAVVTAGMSVVAVTTAVQAAMWRDWGQVGLACYLLAAMLFVGELRAIPVPRGDDTTDELTVSSTFATALVLIGPLSMALLVQMVAVGIDDLRHRRPRRVVLFNLGQYVLTLSAARGAFCLVSGCDFFALTTEIAARDIPAMLAAGAAYFVVNNSLVAVAVALDTRTPILEVLKDDVRFQLATSSILLGLAPVAAHASQFSVAMLPLLLLPILGVHRNAQMSLHRQHEALHDMLTGLPNRELFRRRLERGLATVRQGDTSMAVLLFDLDHFKEINDTLGHHVGDEVIKEVAGRLRSMAPDGATVSRLGGDEFAVLLPDVDLALAQQQGQRFVEALQIAIDVHGVRMIIAASVGIALAPQHADSVETLLKRADIALYRAKSNRGEIQAYRPEIDQHTIERLALLGDLHTAVENDELRLLFQPQVSAGTLDVVAIEALVRWMHPRHGVVKPDVFIPLAENSGLIAPISRWVLEESVAALARWRTSGHDFSMAVNMSARVLSDLDLPGHVADVLDRHGVPASRLTVEVTESTIMADPIRALDVLGQLRAMGVSLAVDDFGTGYSSLAYLRRMEIDELKIDKSFVLQMGVDDNSAIIVRSTVELGHSLGLSVTAEGVEDGPTQDSLVALGCDRIQGFHVSRPLTADALEAWLAARRGVGSDIVAMVGGEAS